jgi:hypothetical protein
MKKLSLTSIILCTIGYLISLTFECCSVNKHALSKREINEWATRGDTILRNNKPVAVYDHLEYELYNGKENIEISINQFDKTPDNTIPLIRFIHYHHKKSKVEIVVISK